MQEVGQLPGPGSQHPSNLQGSSEFTQAFQQPWRLARYDSEPYGALWRLGIREVRYLVQGHTAVSGRAGT